jgi:hypothetical protein
MQVIAVDEAEHAAFAWDIDCWAQARLRPRQRALVEAARERLVRSSSPRRGNPSHWS